MAPELLLRLSCGCVVTLHQGPTYEIMFGRLPRTVAEVEAAHQHAA